MFEANRSSLPLSSTVYSSSTSDNNAKIKKQTKLNFTTEERCNEKILGTYSVQNPADYPKAGNLDHVIIPPVDKQSPPTSTKIAKKPSEVKRKVTKARKMCKEARCTGEKIPRGQPFKNKDECDPNDIGLHFDNVKNMTETELYNLLMAPFVYHVSYLGTILDSVNLTSYLKNLLRGGTDHNARMLMHP